MVKRQNQFATTLDVITSFLYMALEPGDVSVDIPRTSLSECRKSRLKEKTKQILQLK
jgi:hypothetical protein